MAIQFSKTELILIQKTLGLNHLEFYCSEAWATPSAHSRRLLQEHIEKHSPGNLPRGALSLSHNLKMGAYAFTRSPGWQIGFDLEESLRVEAATARRICQTEEEYNAAPNPHFLWSAKEAAFKALLGPHQPTTLSGLTIGNWQSLPETGSSQLETFQFSQKDPRCNLSNRGVVTCQEFYTIAFFAFHP